jgi:hypothetical protein
MGIMPTGVAVISFGMVTANESLKLVFEICTMNMYIHTYIHTHARARARAHTHTHTVHKTYIHSLPNELIPHHAVNTLKHVTLFAVCM